MTPPLRDVVTTARPAAAAALQLGAPSSNDSGQEVGQPTCIDAPADRCAATAPTPAAAPPARPGPVDVEPLTGELARIHVTLPRSVLRKAEEARAALSRSHPGAGLAEIIEAGIDLLLERHAKRSGLVKKPRSEPRPCSDPDHVPAHVRRAVYERDQGRCQFPVASGGVCGSTSRVELHHRTSRHRGGPATVENLTTRCGFHHGLETRREFGDAVVDEIVRRKRDRPPPERAASASAPRAAGGTPGRGHSTRSISSTFAPPSST